MAQHGQAGEVEMEMKFMTLQEADNSKVGEGQDEPNKDPELEIPKNGRNFLDKMSFIKDIVSGLGSLYGGLFKVLKILGVVITLAVIVYMISLFAKF
jgi:hypothetical protein